VSTQHTPGPWAVFGWSIKARVNQHRVCTVGQADKVLKQFGDFDEMQAECAANAALIAAAPDLLALAHCYATECGECAGTRVCPDDEPCTECQFIWDVINKAEGRS
jgi:hypothetical protein